MAPISAFVLYLFTLTVVARGAYHSGGEQTFCEALRYCTDRNETLPVLSDLISLQEFMKEHKQSATWMLDYGQGSMTEALVHCRDTFQSPGACPGLVALRAAVGALRPPVAQCSYSQADVAVCEPPSTDNSVRLPVESRGNFCDALNTCKANGLDIVSSFDSETVRGVLRELETDVVWSLSADAANNWQTFCTSYQPAACPGSIILREPSSYVKRSLIGCSFVTFPVTCYLPEASTATPITVTTDSTTADPNENNSEESYMLTNIIGGAIGALLFIIIIIIIITATAYRLRKRRPHDALVEIPITETKQYETPMIRSPDGAMNSPSPYASLHSQGGAIIVHESPDGAPLYYSQIQDRQLEDNGHYDYITFPDPASSAGQVAVRDAEGDHSSGGHTYLELVP